ncbi:probable glycosyltransferase At5g03795 [Rhododendron vialii]|uniref:probable glycosyltransferase At5g03795 n=1 Tax=Rhododendron vialii TaxID=182163 RepID=UPI00265EB7A5|nr:probable glycosyltransferase At5g03795 [Rhododendron vialii]
MTGPRPLLLALLSSVLLVVLTLALVLPSTIKFKPPQLIHFSTFQQQPLEITPPNPTPTAEPCPPPAKATRNPRADAEKSSEKPGPYHNWEHFNADYNEMMQNLKIYTYPDVHKKSSPFSNIFLPQPDAKKLGNYYSEHAFKTALLSSPLLTSRPEEAHFFYMPFSINLMRLDRRLHSAESIKKFVARYADRISSEFAFWNASGGADHLYVCCHSIGRDAASNHEGLRNSAIQVTCSSSYFQRLYVSHKDVTLPQVWPRPDLDRASTNPPDKRNKLVFFAGREQNARVREKLIALWGKDASMDIFSNNRSFPYEEGFRRSKYCLSVKGYEVNTARVSDAIHFGCIPVIISDYYDLPFTNVLDWRKFSIIINEEDVGILKKILLSISEETYLTMYNNLFLVRRHFSWHAPPRSFDSFYMTTYQLWLRRGLHRLSH